MVVVVVAKATATLRQVAILYCVHVYLDNKLKGNDTEEIKIGNMIYE